MSLSFAMYAVKYVSASAELIWWDLSSRELLHCRNTQYGVAALEGVVQGVFLLP